MVLCQFILTDQDVVQTFRWPLAPGRYTARVIDVSVVSDKSNHADDVSMTLSSSCMATYSLRPNGVMSGTQLEFPIESAHFAVMSGLHMEFDLLINGAQIDWQVSFSTAIPGADFRQVIVNTDIMPMVL